MATSASKYVDYQGSSGSQFRLYLNSDIISQNTGANTSYVHFRLRMYRDSGTYRIYNGTGQDATVASSYFTNASTSSFTYDFNIGVGDYDTILDFYRTITHSSDGTKTITLSGTHDPANSPYLTSTSTGTLTHVLTTINRYATIDSYTRDLITDAGFRLGMNPDVTCDLYQYSLDGGAWTTYYSGSSSGAQYVTFSNLSSGVTHTIRGRVRRQDSGLYTYTDTENVTTLIQNNFFADIDIL